MRRQVRDPHAGPETAAQTRCRAVIVMGLRVRRSRHVLVLVRARVASRSRWRYGVRGGRARQKCQGAEQQQKLGRQPPHAPKASAAEGREQGPLTKQIVQAGQSKASSYKGFLT